MLKHLRRARSIKELSVLGLALCLVGAGAGADAQTTVPLGPLGLMQSSVARVLVIAQASPMGSHERRTGIIRVSHELFDFGEVARRALGQHWKGLSPGEQAEVVQLFTDVLDRAFIASVDEYPNGTVAFLGETIDGARAEVRTQIVSDTGAVTAIDYRLHRRDSRWAVYDVVAEDVSLVANYRSQLNAVIRGSSFADVLERLRRREPATPTALGSNRVAAALLLAVLTRHAPTSR